MNSEKALKFLLDQNADVNLLDKRGRTVIDYVIFFQNRALFNLLKNKQNID